MEECLKENVKEKKRLDPVHWGRDDPIAISAKLLDVIHTSCSDMDSVVI